MEIRGKVVEINLDVVLQTKAGKDYPGFSVSYRDKDNKLQEKTGHQNTLKYNAALKNGLENLQTSDNFVVQAEKNDGGFWEWKSIAKAGDEPKNAAQPYNKPAVASSGGNWATAEERAQTQVYIVRQSSLTNALKLLELQGNKKATTQDVVELASTFEAWVLGKEILGIMEAENKKVDYTDMEDDIPL